MRSLKTLPDFAEKHHFHENTEVRTHTVNLSAVTCPFKDGVSKGHREKNNHNSLPLTYASPCPKTHSRLLGPGISPSGTRFSLDGSFRKSLMPLCQAGTGLTQTRFSPTGRLSPAGNETSVLGMEEGRREGKDAGKERDEMKEEGRKEGEREEEERERERGKKKERK